MEQILQEDKSINEAYDNHTMWITNLVREYDNLLEEQSIDDSPNTRITNVRKIWKERKYPPIFKIYKVIKNIKNEL